MTRLMLTDELWSKLKMIMLQHGIYDKPNLRIMVEGMFYCMRVGCPWRDLPAEFGCQNSIFQKFNRWSSRNLWNKIFKSLVQDPDFEPELITKLPHAEYIIADKGYDSEELRYLIRTKSSIPMIPRKSNSTIGNADMDWCLYKYRHLVESVFSTDAIKLYYPLGQSTCFT